jgi:hypothetical protein
MNALYCTCMYCINYIDDFTLCFAVNVMHVIDFTVEEGRAASKSSH